jgi:hypothetical protein
MAETKEVESKNCADVKCPEGTHRVIRKGTPKSKSGSSSRGFWKQDIVFCKKNK